MTRTTFRVLLGVAIAGAALVLLARVTEASLQRGSDVHWYVVGGVLLVGLQTALIAGLVLQRAQRRRVEQALRESVEQFRLMADTAPVLLWRSGTDTQCDFFNVAWLTFTGRTMEQEVGNGWAEGVWPEDRDRCLQTYRDAFEARRAFRMEYRLRRADGVYRWLLDTGVPRHDADGTFAGYIGSCIDITDIKDAEARVTAGQQRYALATSIGRVGCWDWNLDTNDLYVDPQLKRILGFDETDRVNRFEEWQASLHPDDAEATAAQVLHAIHEGSGGFDIEYRMIHIDGSVRWILSRGCVLRHEDGKAHRVVGTSLDVTERRQASERFRFAMEAAPAGMLMADEGGRIMLVNSHLEQLFGYGREELIGQPVEILIPAALREQHPQHRRGFAQNPRARAMGADQDVAGLHKNGTEVPISIELNPLHTPEGDFVLGSILDITERKRAERETEDLMRRLRELAGSLIQAQEVERARIARDLHDDVGQQLAGISIALSGLKRRIGAAPDDGGLQAEVSSLQRRAAGLAENVRRLSHDLHPAVLEHVGLEAALSAHCLEVQRGHAILVTFMPTGDASTLAPGVALCLYRTAQEGLRNVVQHSRARHAEVRLVCTSDSTELTVGDNGVGFDITAARSSTSGLGLVSIRERVRLLGGSVSIVTESGKGTRVVIRIPLPPRTPTRDAAIQSDAPMV